MGMGRKGVKLEDGRKWRLPGLFYADDLVLCGELEEDLRAMVGWFAEMCRWRGLKGNGGKSKVMVLSGEKRLEGEVHVDRIHLEDVPEFKYLGCILDKGTDGAECSRRVMGAIRALVKAMDLQPEWALVKHETLLVPVLMYGSETVLWKENKRSRISTVQMDNLRGLLGIKRMDRVPNIQIREFCGVEKRLDERIGEAILQWFSHVGRMKSDSIAAKVYAGECAGNHSVVRQWKKWIDTVNECLKKEVWMSGKEGEW